MNCIKCNKKIDENERFCTHCGASQNELDFLEETDAQIDVPIPEKSKKGAKRKKEKNKASEYDFEATKEEKAPKSKDRVNFFLLMLSLLCPPYFGVLITICASAKKTKASQVYGIATILSFIFMKVKNYVLTVLAAILFVLGAICALLFGAYLILGQLGYDVSFITNLFQ